MKNINNFRFDESTGAVYELDKDGDAYFFCGNLNGRSPTEFLNDFDVDQADDQQEDFQLIKR